MALCQNVGGQSGASCRASLEDVSALSLAGDGILPFCRRRSEKVSASLLASQLLEDDRTVVICTL